MATLPPVSKIQLLCFTTLPRSIAREQRLAHTKVVGQRLRSYFNQDRQLVLPGLCLASATARPDAAALAEGMCIAPVGFTSQRYPRLPSAGEGKRARKFMSQVRGIAHANRLTSLLLVAEPGALFSFLDASTTTSNGFTWETYAREAGARVHAVCYNIELELGQAQVVRASSYGNLVAWKNPGYTPIIPSSAAAA